MRGWNLIAAVDSNWAIGKKGELLVSIPLDKKHFREITMGGVVVGGRKTMEGLPGGTILQGRKNIILTSKRYILSGVVRYIRNFCRTVTERILQK